MAIAVNVAGEACHCVPTNHSKKPGATSVDAYSIFHGEETSNYASMISCLQAGPVDFPELQLTRSPEGKGYFGAKSSWGKGCFGGCSLWHYTLSTSPPKLPSPNLEEFPSPELTTCYAMENTKHY